MEALECIMTRRSIRAYTKQAVPEELIKKLLEAGAAAPSAANQQPWHFIVIDDRKLLTGIAAIHPHAQMLKSAPVAVGIAYDAEVKKPFPKLLVDDLAAATENMLLAAHGLGLGAVWIGVHHSEEYQTEIGKLLGLPAGVKIISIVSAGYTDETRSPRKYLQPEMVHKNGW